MDNYILDAIHMHDINIINVEKFSDLNTILLSDNYDIFYTGMPYKYRNIVFPENIKVIGTFHGLRPIEKYTDKFEYLYDNIFRAYAKSMLKNLRTKKIVDQFSETMNKFEIVFCDSEHSKYSIINHINYKQDKIKVFYAPPKEKSNKPSTNFSSCYTKTKYILMIGGNRWIKNVYRAIIAIDQLYTKNLIANISTIIVGNPPNRIKHRIKNKDRFIFIDYVDADNLEELYKCCDIFIYPTLNEGFGLPPLEAMAYGKTCIVSAVCSLPEICGSAVYYVNPYDIQELQARIILSIDNHIDERKVIEQFTMIQKKQETDLIDLCKEIIK